MVGVKRFLQFLSTDEQRDFCEKKLFRFLENVDQVDDIIMRSTRPTERTFVCCSKESKKEGR